MNQARLILAVVLSMAVFFAYSKWFSPPPPLPPSSVSQPEKAEPVTSDGVKKEAGSLPEVSGIVPEIPAVEVPGVEKVFLENNEIGALFSTVGGILTDWTLKKFHQKPSGDSPLINLLNGKGGEALLLTIGDEEYDKQPVLKRVEESDPNKVTFLWTSAELEIRKSFVMSAHNPYLVDVSVEITNRGSKDAGLRPRLWISRRQKEQTNKGGFFSFLKQKEDLYVPALFADGKLKVSANWEKLPEKTEQTGKIYWTALNDRYFIMSLISRLESGKTSVAYGKSGNEIYTSLAYEDIVLGPGQKTLRRFSTFFGPKKREELKKLGVNLETSVDYGWFAFMAIPLLWLLIFFHKIVGNWGIAIIVLTFFVKLLLHPINKKSMESMKAMQVLQPKMKELREKYKNDREKLNMEVMMLFKAHKVNPMGGCIPLVIQMPVYIALYKVLWNAIELYHAPFFWFYKDLSAPDPYMISPILLGILMAAQQKLTPQSATMDPAQQKMMTIMPLMFSAFMIFFPSGLVIYIFVNTVMSVVQQYMLHKNLSFLDLLKKGHL